MSLQELDRIAKRDPLHPLTFQEKELLRGLEDDVRLYHPTLLPRMIDCVDYTNYQVKYQLRFFHPDVSEMRPTRSLANNQKLSSPGSSPSLSPCPKRPPSQIKVLQKRKKE